MASKIIRINHVEAVENYLEEESLVYIDLERNAGIVRGVNRLINILPKSFEPKDIKKFYISLLFTKLIRWKSEWMNRFAKESGEPMKGDINGR